MEFYRSHVLVCAGAGCVSSGCKAVESALLEGIKRFNLEKEVRVVETGCMGPCDMGPIVVVYPEGVFYRKVKPEDVGDIVEQHLLKGRTVERLLYSEPGTRMVVPKIEEIDFFTKQTRIALRNTGVINPESIEEYIARDGYSALGKVLSSMTPEQVIDAVKRSGLRGRGGAGFPTGMKWEFTAKAQGSPKYVVCNADEGDPGAFMDRSVLEGDPHTVIEAMAICGYAIGANQGYVYVRAEYPLAVERLGKAIVQAREYGLLGNNIFGTPFSFDLEIRVGAGAFVCGEETALLASVMGKRGEPRPRPPFPAQSGLWDKPTVLNNVETWANVPPIILKGPEWFASLGTEKSKGTKVFALAGKIQNTGLVEVPMGIPLGEIIYDIGGGIPKGKKFKAAQTGGPSGGCIPPEYLSTPVDYESLAALGTIMGSGGLIIMDEDTCMVDLAKFFLEFCQDESCGKCAPCRIGTKRMYEILDRITKGQGKEGDVELLIELGKQIKNAALCGLGQTAPNPVLSTIKYFREEYDEHIREKKCRASVCATLFDSPCQNTCPAGIDVPIYVDYIKQKKHADAYLTVKRDNPFPLVCGRVCDHPCESKCRRAQIEQPVAIRTLKRFAADWELENKGELPTFAPAKTNGKKVAVVGAGPAGLSCAHYLALKGYKVTVFEALPVAGGMLAVGIPEYRLPKKLLAAEIESFKALGVEIKTGVKVGKDVTVDDLKKQGYQAIFVAVGAHADQKLGVPGEELEGVVSGVKFLRDLNLGKDPGVKGKKVAVIGGGNVAMDAARSALRCGAAEVSVIYRRRKEDMPAIPGEVDEAMHEGVKFTFLAAPLKVTGKDGKAESLECQRMNLGEFDRSGRRRPVPAQGATFAIPADLVVSAIGQAPEGEALAGTGVTLAKGGTVEADQKTMATRVKGIFAGGDCVTGPDTVIRAIAAGKKAASEIDRYLGGDGNVVPTVSVTRAITGEIIEKEMPRVKVGCIADRRRVSSFDEVELGLAEDAAVTEASRCLRCDVKEA
ncbi:MAG: NADH-quinone oxidoreductase subunit NuoF [Firmicutes bacterium]|nr:NADH-quinone oxidoreductase subunit NuoF [Bacillota bacterium]